ncbi:hypothetical protein [Nocardia carnea]|uniref:hypothetical protein n=1 Tax=Nocardia carnea TaxID=37328 RepID=UPI002455911B|nr:hypothetical protein [Nocardia carnea]
MNLWWSSDATYIRAINEIDEELGAERTARSDLAYLVATEQAELRNDIAGVGSRVDAITDRIGAVLEWTELRFQQLEYDEYRARTEIRKGFRALAQDRPVPLPVVDDVPGYWMPPAARAAMPLIRREHRPGGGDPFADPESGLVAAHERDDLRTELFALAVGLCFDLPAYTAAAVPRLLRRPVGLGHTEEGRVAAGWRALWEHTARGAFGPAAAAELAGRLAASFDPATLDAGEFAAWDRAIDTFAAASTKAEAVTALHTHLMAEAEATATFTAQDHPYWRDLLQELVEEPSPGERPLREAMDALQLLPGGQLRHSAPSWAAPAGTVAELLRHDLFDPAAPVPLRHLALRIATPLLRARLTEPPTAPDPVVTTIERRGVPIEVTSAGYDSGQLAVVDRRIMAHYLADTPSTTANALGAAALAGLAAVVAVFGPLFVAVLCALGATIPLWNYFRARAAARAAAVHRDEQLAEVRAALDRAGESVRAEEHRRAEQHRAARAAFAQLLTALPTAQD